MEDETSKKILKLLDVLSIEVSASRNDTAELRGEMHARFARVDGRLDGIDGRLDAVECRLSRIETRTEDTEIEVRAFRGEFERRVSPLEPKRDKG